MSRQKSLFATLMLRNTDFLKIKLNRTPTKNDYYCFCKVFLICKKLLKTFFFQAFRNKWLLFSLRD